MAACDTAADTSISSNPLSQTFAVDTAHNNSTALRRQSEIAQKDFFIKPSTEHRIANQHSQVNLARTHSSGIAEARNATTRAKAKAEG